MNIRHFLALSAIFIFLTSCGSTWSHSGGGGFAGIYDVHSFGATGDGKTIDTDAVNRAILSARDNGGGTVRFPPGTYVCFSIHLQSNVALYLEHGAVIQAAKPPTRFGIYPCYDAPEPNPVDRYQDFGHTHWHNSLIWGENLENVSILGPGMIDGSKGLVRSGEAKPGDGVGNPPPPAATKPSTRPAKKKKSKSPTTKPTTAPADPGYPNPRDTVRSGLGNKMIALKLCRNVTLRDVSLFAGGHFAILATGVDNFTMDNLKIDTVRDGMDIDCCKNVRVSNCYVNSPYDDGICPKASFALGYNKPTENVTITNCQVSGYICGSLLDGTFRMFPSHAGREFSPTGRIKLGTEGNGGFRNITISNCVFDYCRGLALEEVDGGLLEDVAISNITMRHISNSPIFLRLGARDRGPAGTVVGTLQRINISNVVVYDADPQFSSIITGIPGHDIADVQLNHIQIFTRGGGKQAWATTQTLEKIRDYPEPRNFGQTASYGFFVRHVKGIEFNDVKVGYGVQDPRAVFVVKDASDIKFNEITAQHIPEAPIFRLQNVVDLLIQQCAGVADTRMGLADHIQFGGSGPTTEPTTEPATEPADPADADPATEPTTEPATEPAPASTDQ